MGKQANARTKAGRFRKGASGNPDGRPRMDATETAPRGLYGAMQPHLDGWQNAATGLGIAGKDKSVSTDFSLDVVAAEDAQQIWRGDPIGARIVEVLPNECVRQGFELSIGDQEPPETFKPPEPALTTPPVPGAKQPPARKPAPRGDGWQGKKHPSAFARRVRSAITYGRLDAGESQPLTDSISKKLKDLGAISAIREAMCYERAGGGGAILLGANDFTTDLRIPLDIKKVRSLDYLTPLEARELIPLYYYNDPQKPKFGRPAIYQLIPFVVGAPVDGYAPRVTQIHESRLIVFEGIRVSRRVMSCATRGWGDSVFTRCVRALRGYNVGHQSAEILLSDFAQAVYKIKGLADLVSKNPNALTDSMMNVELGRSIARAVVIDSEEEFERKSTTMTGYPETLDRLARNLAATADMPMTLMLGSSPDGQNATGASDIRFFYDRVSTHQINRVAPALLRLIEILIAVAGKNPDTVTHSVTFNPLWQPTEKEVAETHFTQAQADAIYLTNDVVSPEEMAISRFGSEVYSLETHIDFEARAAQEAVVSPTVQTKPDPIPAPNTFDLSPDPNEPGAVPSAAKQPQNAQSPGKNDE